LLVARGRFWDASADGLRRPGADEVDGAGGTLPDVRAVVPARDEADVIARTLRALVAQDYRGRFAVTVVDDGSGDGTADVVRAVIAESCASERGLADERVRVVAARPRPVGWTGKVWALGEGVAAVRASGARPAYWWFSDADVEHAPDTLARLVATAHGERRELVSLMVALHCRSRWERLLIPAFVFFFRLLYPFAWVNDDRRATAGAAGGCVLLADDALVRIGGVERVAGELIDDCALAAAVKGSGGGLWLGLATSSRSVRPYSSLDAIWAMVARSAYTQLGHSPPLLAGTVAGMILLYVVPPVAAVGGVLARRGDVALPGAVGWGLMALAYAPMLRLYGVPRAQALALPLAAGLYTAMTVDSALRHARGSGGMWKGRGFRPA
jgi:hopene-associated glycosyltransferase HpnB